MQYPFSFTRDLSQGQPQTLWNRKGKEKGSSLGQFCGRKGTGESMRKSEIFEKEYVLKNVGVANSTVLVSL